MISPLHTSQLAERISRAAREAETGGRRATASDVVRGELPPVPEAVSPPPLPALTTDAGPSPTNRFPLDEAANQIPRARGKVTVPKGVPAWLRPFYRNQGGFNFVLLEALERLVDANRQLQRQNHELRERVVAISGWMSGASQTSQHDREWMTAVENRLRGITADRLAELETRLAALEREPSPK